MLSAWAVPAESLGRIHRFKRVSRGAPPLMYGNGDTADSLGIIYDEVLDVILPADLKPHQDGTLRVTKDGVSRDVTVQCHIDTPVEIDYYKNGGILQTVLWNILTKGDEFKA